MVEHETKVADLEAWSTCSAPIETSQQTQHEGMVQADTEGDILRSIFELKEEQIFCLQRQLWTKMQLQHAAHTAHVGLGDRAEGRVRTGLE